MHLIIYTNILTPYRKYFYDLLNNVCTEQGDQFHVIVMAETEPNRTWKYEDLKGNYTILLKDRMFSIGDTYFHYNDDLEATLEKLKLDILVCAGGYNCPAVWKAVYLKKKLKYKCYFWSESHLNEVKKNSSIKIMIREAIRTKIYQKFDGFWYAGKLSKDFCERYASDLAKYIFVPNIVDESIYTKKISDTQNNVYRKCLGLKAETVVFLCPARLSPEKGILEFLDVVRDYGNKDKFVILIAGTGKLQEKILIKSKAYGIDVRLLGERRQDDMRILYGVADIFLLPSLSDPNPLTCIEALWSKLPLLISEHCGNNLEVVKQGENGFVFSYTDKQKLLQMFEFMVKSDKTWRELAGNVSFEIGQQLYMSETVAKRIVNEIKLLI